MSGFEPPRQVDIVLMFDSFHHCQDPADLVRRLGRATSRFLLVEPHAARMPSLESGACPSSSQAISPEPSPEPISS
jgi:hypothetical protein